MLTHQTHHIIDEISNSMLDKDRIINQLLYALEGKAGKEWCVGPLKELLVKNGYWVPKDE